MVTSVHLYIVPKVSFENSLMFPKTIKQAILSHKPPKTKMVIDRLLTFCVNIVLLFFFQDELEPRTNIEWYIAIINVWN